MKKSTMAFVFTALLAFSSHSFAHEEVTPNPPVKKETESSTILNHYINVQEKLAADSVGGVKWEASAIQKAAEKQRPAIALLAEKLASAKTIQEAREIFKELSTAVTPLVNGMSNREEFEIVSCSMAKATWIQRKGAVKNPYYGKAMLSCGDKI